MARSNPKPDPNEAITNRLLENIQKILENGVTALPVPGKPPGSAPAPNFPTSAKSTPAFPTVTDLPGPRFPTLTAPRAPFFPTLGNVVSPTAPTPPSFPTLATPTSYQQIPPPPTPPQIAPPPILRQRKQRSRLEAFFRPLTTRVRRGLGLKGRQAFGEAWPHLQGVLPGGGRSETAQAASGVRGVGELAAAVPGKAGAVIEVGAKLIAIVLETTDKLNKLSQSLHEADMLFAEFSGAMATVKAERYAQEITLSRERGDRRASSAQYLSEGQMDLKRVTAPIEDLSAMVKDRVVGLMDRAMARLLEPLASMAEKILKWFDDDEDDDSKGIDMFDTLNETWRRHRDEVMGTRPRGMQP